MSNSPEATVVAISSCLLGYAVRYDKKSKADDDLHTKLAAHFRLRPICPEVGAGLGVPRPAIELVHSTTGASPLIFRRRDRKEAPDITEKMQRFARAELEAIARAPIHGYVCKTRSPSCALHDAGHFAEGADTPSRLGSGYWIGLVKSHFPKLPISDETELQDPAHFAKFVEEVRRYRRESVAR